MVKFSIIIPVYNLEDYLYRCLYSVLNQDIMILRLYLLMMVQMIIHLILSKNLKINIVVK